jgi:hypothetical protein
MRTLLLGHTNFSPLWYSEIFCLSKPTNSTETRTPLNTHHSSFSTPRYIVSSDIKHTFFNFSKLKNATYRSLLYNLCYNASCILEKFHVIETNEELLPCIMFFVPSFHVLDRGRLKYPKTDPRDKSGFHKWRSENLTRNCCSTGEKFKQEAILQN